MIKNEKRTAKQEKKFIKQLRKLGGRLKAGYYLLAFGEKEFLYYTQDKNKGELHFYNGSTWDLDLAQYPTIPQVLSLIKEHTGEDLSHKLKPTKTQRISSLEETTKLLEARIAALEQHQENLLKISKLEEESKDGGYKFGDMVEVVGHDISYPFNSGSKCRFLASDNSQNFPYFILYEAEREVIWVDSSQIKKV